MTQGVSFVKLFIVAEPLKKWPSCGLVLQAWVQKKKKFNLSSG